MDGVAVLLQDHLRTLGLGQGALRSAPAVTTLFSAMVTSTPAGTVMGILPILDIVQIPPYHTNARTSPPTCAARATVGHMEVDTIAMPRPRSTQGQLVGAHMNAQAGLGRGAGQRDDLLLAGIVLWVMRITPWVPSSITWKD